MSPVACFAQDRIQLSKGQLCLHVICCLVAQIGLDFYESQMVGTLPNGLSNDVTSYRADAFTYETGASLGKGFGDVSGGWCTGDQVGELPLAVASFGCCFLWPLLPLGCCFFWLLLCWAQ